MGSCGWTRRAFALLPAGAVAAAAARGKFFPASRYRYSDPATESNVDRLTAPSWSSFLSPSNLRCVSRRRFLLFSSDRGGSLQAFQLDLKTGQSRQLTEAAELDRASIALLPGDESFVYFDGAYLKEADLKKLKDRELHRVPDGFQRAPGFGMAQDGTAAWIEVQNGVSRLRVLFPAGGEPETIFEAAGEISRPMPVSGARHVLFRRQDGSLWVTGFGQQPRKLNTGSGPAGAAYWQPDTAKVLYLSVPGRPGEQVAICESDPETGEAATVAPTSKYAQFSVNTDGSVFGGAGGSAAAPYLFLMLRLTKRELPLCEHRASNPAMAEPVFSPDSQRLYFVSDRDGKPAVYSVSLEKLAEPT